MSNTRNCRLANLVRWQSIANARPCTGSVVTSAFGMPTKAFMGHYYLSGDTAELNDDGCISFVGRNDDVITTSDYRVGPFDVESALMEHPAVIEDRDRQAQPAADRGDQGFRSTEQAISTWPETGRNIAATRPPASRDSCLSTRNRVRQ